MEYDVKGDLSYLNGIRAQANLRNRSGAITATGNNIKANKGDTVTYTTL